MRRLNIAEREVKTINNALWHYRVKIKNTITELKLEMKKSGIDVAKLTIAIEKEFKRLNEVDGMIRKIEELGWEK